MCPFTGKTIPGCTATSLCEHFHWRCQIEIQLKNTLFSSLVATPWAAFHLIIHFWGFILFRMLPYKAATHADSRQQHICPEASLFSSQKTPLYRSSFWKPPARQNQFEGVELFWRAAVISMAFSADQKVLNSSWFKSVGNRSNVHSLCTPCVCVCHA